MTAESKTEDGDVLEQIGQLRAQVETLLRERVAPFVEEAAAQAEEIAGQQTEALAGHIRAQPIVSVLIAAGVGYLLGRLSR